MILQISRIQQRRGLQEDLPEMLASAELGWSIDQRRLFIGNGTHEEGAPELGNTEILTTHSDVLSLDNLYSFRGLLGGYEVQTGDTVSSKVTRTLQDKFDDTACIRDFGTPAMGNGVFNCARSFNRAIERLYKSTSLLTTPAVRRTLHVPAGTYLLSGDYIRLLPYVKLKGDGKNSTFIIQTDATQPCTVMSTGVNNNGVLTVNPGNIEVDGITFLNSTGNDVVILDSTVDVLFDRVGMRYDNNANRAAPTTVSSTDFDIATAGIRIRYSRTTAASTGFTTAPQRIYLNDCDFDGKDYGILTKDYTSEVVVTGASFNNLYRGVAIGLGNLDDSATPSGIKITHSVFDNIAAEGIVTGTIQGYAGAEVHRVVSAFNTFANVGNLQRTAVGDSEPTPFSSVISFNGDNCYSFGDTFTRTSASAIPAVNLNGKASFATLPDGHVIIGKQYQTGGTDTVLPDGQLTLTTAGIIGFSNYPTIVEYTLLRGEDQRVGTLHITPLAGSAIFSDDYVETNELGITLEPVLNNNVVELQFTSTALRRNTILKLASRTLLGEVAPSRLPDTVPGSPTNVVATQL